MDSPLSFSYLQTRLSYLSPEDCARVRDAYLVAKQAHFTQTRISGESYICHPVAVSYILAGLKLDAESLMAALLHDVVEDTEVTRENLSDRFGTVVADLVEGVTKISRVRYDSVERYQVENYRKMFLAMSKDIRVIIIKLADRLHNMRTIQVLPAPKRKKMAMETLELYSPIAKRLGMQMVSIELDDLGFSALYPFRYRILLAHMYRVSGGQVELLKHIEGEIKVKAKSLQIEVAEITAREKQFYGIYQKMIKKKRFSDLMDVYALRVCVNSLQDCYAVIGIVHAMYMPKAGCFKDYIASPKRNGYQSLHTVLYGPNGAMIEIQVKTQEMHLVATQGVAAHWLYKSGQTEFNCRKHQVWFDDLTKIKTVCSDDATALHLLKTKVGENEVYVLTPQRKIVEMKVGATALDMAFYIHTDLGFKAKYAIIDREKVPLSHRLKNGQTVEIVQSDKRMVRPSWLDFVTTSKAKQSIKAFLKEQEVCTQDQLGHNILVYRLEQAGLGYMAHRKIVDDTLSHAGYRIPEVYGQLSRGELLVEEVVDACRDYYTEGRYTDSIKPITVNGGDTDILAACCYPVFGDCIAGCFSASAGLTVHRKSCRQLDVLPSNQCVSVSWGEPSEQLYTSVCSIQLKYDYNSLSSCIAMLTDMRVSVIGFRRIVDGELNQYDLTIRVQSLEHLSLVIQSLQQLKLVVSVYRG
ncbi:RelA/SpoT family protein [Candidatus Comchoanobacter bicostacola]|uniref:RelA/SpoT family protein n=1 Tax=Candidatus Comchoanobacter bicostacola TaxID=2919598 RepID=A0ABY5DKU6_9GAMM|nr:RelA/SpoT family protein [Candidatus Comchoanobacter bicostacola]UTC24427.1 RelA/SpoT family protein [Candidatus Comchoanobacter bicostacola]